MASGLRSASPFVHGSRTLIGNGTTIGGRSPKWRKLFSTVNMAIGTSSEGYFSALDGLLGGRHQPMKGN
jgi:hypothetical protein